MCSVSGWNVVVPIVEGPLRDIVAVFLVGCTVLMVVGYVRLGSQST